MSLMSWILGKPKATVPDDDDERSWFTNWALGGEGTESGESITPDKAMRITTVAACVRVVSEDIAALPLKLYRRDPNGDKMVTADHRLYALMHDQPNRYQTSLEFRETMQRSMMLRGNAYGLIVRTPRGQIDSIGFVPAQWTTIKRAADGELIYEFREPGGKAVIVGADDVLHLKDGGDDAYQGKSRVTQAREALGLAVALEKHGARLFRNGARFSGILIHPGKISQAAQGNLQKSFDQQARGSNQHRTAILEEGVKYQQVTMTSEDAQFLETRGYTRTEIAALYRVPPHMIGDLSRATFSNIESQSISYVVGTLLPWVRRWESRLNLLLTEAERAAGYFFEFSVDGLLRGDIASRYAAYAVGRQWGWLSANDIRRSENMNAIPEDQGGDDYLVPLNMRPGGEPPEAPEPTEDMQEDAAKMLRLIADRRG